MSKILASRYHFSTGWSEMYPWPPRICTAFSATLVATSNAFSLDMEPSADWKCWSAVPISAAREASNPACAPTGRGGLRGRQVLGVPRQRGGGRHVLCRCSPDVLLLYARVLARVSGGVPDRGPAGGPRAAAAAPGRAPGPA